MLFRSLHDEARYRERLGLAPAHKSFKDIAQATVQDMRRDLAAGTGKKIYVRKLPLTVNKLKIETSISMEMRDEEVEIYGKPNCWHIG